MNPETAYILILMACALYWAALRLIIESSTETATKRLSRSCVDCGLPGPSICEECLERRR